MTRANQATTSYQGQWVCTNLSPNSIIFQSGCLFTTDKLSSAKFSDTGFTTPVLTHRIDAGASNPNLQSTNSNGAQGVFNLIKFANNCAKDHPGYTTPMFKQGTDFYRLDNETQQLLCDNEADYEAEMIYFACCDLTSKVCVDPIVTSAATSATNDIAPSGGSSSNTGISASSVVGIAVGASAGGGLVALGGAYVAYKAFSKQATSHIEQDQEQELRMTLMDDCIEML
jgi:hypothetical protein